MQTAKFDHDHGHACRDCYGVRSASSSAVEESAASGQEQNFGTGIIGVVEIRQHPVDSRFGRGTPARLGAVSKILRPPRRFRANEWRVSVVDCGSPLPLCVARLPVKKRQRAAAVQNLAESSSRLSGAATVFVKPLQPADSILWRRNWARCSAGGNTSFRKWVDPFAGESIPSSL